MCIFLRSIKLNQYFLYMRQWSASMKTLRVLKLVPKAASDFSPASYLCHWTVFSTDHLSLDGGKIHQNIHVSGTIFIIIRVPEQVTGAFLNDATRSVKRVPVRILIISKEKSSLFCLVLQILSGYIMRKVVLSLLLRG
jgi:hypothetical protein